MVRISTMIAGVMLCGAVFGASTLARADHNERFGVLWPKIYAPTITGNLFDDDEEEYIETERIYERQKLRRAKPRVVKRTAVRTIDDVKRPLVKQQALAVVLRPKLKPATLQLATTQVQKPIATTQAKLVLAEPVIAPKTNQPSVASAATTSNTIGCSKGVEIITGYGFSRVKPKSCAGSAYAFDATRANAAYVITLSAATGEITDVKKL